MEFYDIRLIENKDALRQPCKIIIYGAGYKGKQVAKLLHAAEIQIQTFCDQSSELDGNTIIHNIGCLSPGKLIVSQILADETIPIYMIACIERPEEAWELFSGVKDNVRFITYWGISEHLYKYRYAYFVGNDEILWEYDKNNIHIKIGWATQISRYLQWYIDYRGEILVLTPGKVGSTSICRMIENSGKGAFHTHVMGFPHFLGALDCLKEEWNHIFSKINNIKIVCLVRNPLDKDYSHFWQIFRRGDIGTRNRIIFSEYACMQDMYDDYINTVIMSGESFEGNKYGYMMPVGWGDEFRWFDREIKKVLGIDIYDEKFDVKKGYAIYEKEGVEIFLGRLENFADVIPVLSKFIGADLQMERVNTADSAWFSMAYKEFRKEVKISQEYVDHYFKNNIYVDHFYSKDEQMRFLSKWQENITK